LKFLKSSYFLFIACLVPIIRLQFIANMTLFDCVNGIFLLFFIAYLLAKGEFKIPFWVPALIILAGSLISMINSLYPHKNLIALMTDLYLFLFFIILYNIIKSKTELKGFVLLWLIFAAFQGGLMFYQVILNYTGRAQGTFLNPNMGAHYLGMSFFLLFLDHAKMDWKIKAFLASIIVGGFLATKSLSGIAVFFLSLLILVFLYLLHTGLIKKLKFGLVVLSALVIGLIIFPKVKELPNLMERAPKSIWGRKHLWQSGIEYFIRSPLGIGIGPGAFAKAGPPVSAKKRSEDRDAVMVRRELHSDWLAYLTERGFIAFIGLVIFYIALLRRLAFCRSKVESEADSLWIFGLAGMLAFFMMSSFFHEILHFRHVWCGFAVIAVESKLRGMNIVSVGDDE
jgi:O-antigen ligase